MHGGVAWRVSGRYENSAVSLPLAPQIHILPTLFIESMLQPSRLLKVVSPISRHINAMSAPIRFSVTYVSTFVRL